MNTIKFNNDIILEKAFEIAVENGFNSISVRSVAKEVGCSTTPVYTAYSNIENLIQATKLKALKVIEEMVAYRYTDIEFLNIGVGKILFASTYPKLYKELFIDNPDYVMEKQLRELYLELLENDLIAKYMTKNELEMLLTKMWLTVHGTSTMICSQSIKDYKVEDFIVMLAELGEQLIFSTLMKNGNLDKYTTAFRKSGHTRITHTFNWNIWI